MITTRQQTSIDRIKAEIVRSKSLGTPGKYEFKQFKITDGGNLVFLVAEYGMIGDEDTAASILCRDHRHFMIGRKGGIALIANYRFGRKRAHVRVNGLFSAINHF